MCPVTISEMNELVNIKSKGLQKSFLKRDRNHDLSSKNKLQ